MSRAGAELVVEALCRQGVRHLFTVSGNHVLSVYDATIGRDIDLIHARHEATAVHMADAWGRLDGRPGIALVTGGPGHANALSALYGALMSQSPMLLLSGHCATTELGRGGFQEMDQAGLAGPVTKASRLVTDPSRLGQEVAAALHLAVAWPPGPVHLSLPSDVLETRVAASAGTPDTASAPDIACGERAASAHASDAEIHRAIALLGEARRPLIVAGPAASRGDRWAALGRLTEITDIPVIASESPRGMNDPSLRAAVQCLEEADAVLLVGKRLDFSLRFGRMPPFAPECRFVGVGMGPGLDGGGLHLALAGEPALIVDGLANLARARVWSLGGWRADVEAARASVPGDWVRIRCDDGVPIHPLRVCRAIQPHLSQGGIFISDGGEFGQWAQAALEAGTRLINGPSGSIGSAIPMALAARLRHPGRSVLVTLGDGAFGYAMAEFDTAARYGLPVVAVVGNDGRWNAEYQLQIKQYGPERAVGCDLRPSPYERIVEALGGYGERVERPAELDGALERAIASGLPACVNVLIEPAAAPTFGATPRKRPA